MAQAASYWVTHGLPARKRAPATEISHRRNAVLIAEGLGPKRVQRLTADHVEAFFRSLAAKGYAYDSVRLVRSTLAQVLDEAMRRGTLTRNAARLAVIPAEVKPRRPKRALRADECSALLAVIEGHPLGSYFALALATGARRGELLALQWSDISFDERTMSITRGLRKASTAAMEIGPTKTPGSVRMVGLSASAVAALRAHRTGERKAALAQGRAWSESDHVFCDERGEPLHPNVRYAAWREITREAGLIGVTPHELRHSAGSYALDAGMSHLHVADYLGNTVTTLERTYRHRTKPVATGVADVMEALLAKKTP